MAASVAVEELVKTYGDLRAVDGLSFTVETGEVLGFLGPNGAGKSTTMKMITGFLPPTSGHASVCGYSIADQPLEAKRCLGYLPEGAPAYGEMTPWQFLNFIADIRRPQNRAECLDRVVGQLALGSVLHRPIDTLSKGYHRRVGLAQAMLHDPQVLIMDEPTDGLDPNQKQQVRQFISDMARDKTIIISTHILEEVEAICTRAIIIADGKVLVDETPEALRGRSRYSNAVTIQDDVAPEVRRDLAELDDVAVAEPEREQGLTLIPKPDCVIEEPVRRILQRHGLQDIRLFIQPGRLDDVFRTLTHHAHE